MASNLKKCRAKNTKKDNITQHLFEPLGFNGLKKKKKKKKALTIKFINFLINQINNQNKLIQNPLDSKAFFY